MATEFDLDRDFDVKTYHKCLLCDKELVFTRQNLKRHIRFHHSMPLQVKGWFISDRCGFFLFQIPVCMELCTSTLGFGILGSELGMQNPDLFGSRKKKTAPEKDQNDESFRFWKCVLGFHCVLYCGSLFLGRTSGFGIRIKLIQY